MATTTTPGSPDVRALVDYARSLDCIHCGLCLTTCPTYQLSGAESSSPRGRIHLMRAVAEERLAPDAEFADEMDFCLVCRHCESVCPAGVQFGAMMEVARDNLSRGFWERLLRRLGFRVLLVRRGALRLAFGALRAAQRAGVVRLLGPLLGARGRSLASLPAVPAARERRSLPAATPAVGERRASVALLEGCVMPELFGRVNRATVRALSALGVETRVPEGVVCCGSLHAHNGDREGARALARRLLDAFDELRGENATGGPAADRPLAVVTNSAGCGSHLRELFHLFPEGSEEAERARAFAGRVVDFSQLAAERLAAAGARPALSRTDLRGPVTFDDPCHLCHGQGVRREPRAVLDAIAGLERVELEDSESCCGSAGLYSLLRPADAGALLERKLEALRKSGARTLVTANPGCHVQWQAGIAAAGLPVRTMHLAEVLSKALGAEP